MSAFFCKKSAFFSKNKTFTRSSIVRAVLAIFNSVFSFCKIAVTVNENISFTDYASGIRLSDCSKLAKNRKNDSDVTISRYDVIIKFFWHCLFLLSSLVTGSNFMSISLLVLELWQFSFIRVDQKSPEIGNTPIWVLHNIWGLGPVRDTKVVTNISRKYLYVTKCCKMPGLQFLPFLSH